MTSQQLAILRDHKRFLEKFAPKTSKDLIAALNAAIAELSPCNGGCSCGPGEAVITFPNQGIKDKISDAPLYTKAKGE